MARKYPCELCLLRAEGAGEETDGTPGLEPHGFPLWAARLTRPEPQGGSPQIYFLLYGMGSRMKNK